MVLNPRSDERLGDIAGATLTTALTGAVNGALNRSYSSRLYNMTLRGPMPDRILYVPQLAFEADSAMADACLTGRYALAGGQVQMTEGTPWDVTAPNRQWSEDLHSFEWLWHFNARGGHDTSKHAGWLVNSWLERHRQCEGLAWEPHILGRRLVSWFANWSLIVGTADMVWRSSLLLSMARQARHLRRAAPSAPIGLPRLTSAWALAMVGLCMPNEKRAYERGMTLLIKELQQQVLADGGHISRSPEILLKVLCDLLILRDAIQGRSMKVPNPLQRQIDRMAPAVDFFRHGDGHLSFFNGSGEGDKAAIDTVVATDQAATSPLSHLPYSGFHRLRAGKTVLLMDAGAGAPGPYSTTSHAGCLSFELSVGRNRLITNCGNIAIQGPEWQEALRATPAHSTVVVNDCSSAGFVEDGWSRRLLGPRMTGGPKKVTSVQRRKDDVGFWLDASHDGYEENFGLIHDRRLFLDAKGTDLRGEDSLVPSDGGDTNDVVDEAVVRFHLHPDVRASLARDKSSVLLLLPNREGWQFRAQGGEMSLESSIYAADGNSVRRTQQIVLTCVRPASQVRFNWAFSKLDSD
jgi:uncharacterized heparinase superfamily protein